jgi:exodeoxyribonuclease VII small subunit
MLGDANPVAEDNGGARPELNYEQARDELIETVRRLEAGGTSLEESLALWQRGEELAAICQRWLDGARVRLQQAVDSTDR